MNRQAARLDSAEYELRAASSVLGSMGHDNRSGSQHQLS
jgi:hypothetical protein